MTSLLLTLALASPSLAGVVAADADAVTYTEGRAPASAGTRIGARLGFSMRNYGLDCIYELQGGWVSFPEDDDRLSASGFDAGTGIRLGYEILDLRPEAFAHIGVDGLYQTQVEVRDDQRGRRRTSTDQEDVRLGVDAGVGITYIGFSGIGVGLHGMWQTTLAIETRRERLTAGVHLELRPW